MTVDIEVENKPTTSTSRNINRIQKLNLSFQKVQCRTDVNRQSYQLTRYTDPKRIMKASKIPDEIVDDYDNEPPLLEGKTIAVLNPTRAIHQDILEDTDIAGPLVFCLALASILLLAGKVTFSYIYGIGAVGCVGFYTLLSLMASQSEVTFGAVVSVLGYSLLPMVALSGINLIFTIQYVQSFNVNLSNRCIQLACPSPIVQDQISIECNSLKFPLFSLLDNTFYVKRVEIFDFDLLNEIKCNIIVIRDIATIKSVDIFDTRRN
uniref:Protein YIPF n=1 Tax=Glossina brevipalpis TaxID=37001 RepID=A0A1A9WHM0_9MUSC